jgi:hypothetical protein
MSAFSIYKPFRNLISTFGREDALRVLWAYINYMQVDDFELPADIEAGAQFLNSPVPAVVIPPWQLELIAKEILIHCGTRSARGKTLREWRSLAKVMNELRELEDKFYALQGPAKNIMLELNRIAHRQFVWQAHPLTSAALMRYLKIFDTPQIDEICRSQTGMTVQTIYLCGMCFLGHFLSSPAIPLPVNSEIKQLSNTDIVKFVSFCSRPLRELREVLESEQVFDDRFAYAFSSLRGFPLIQMPWDGNDAIVCPIVTLLFWRITGGLYYSLCKHKQFGDAFGRSFQAYVGEVISRSISRPNSTLLAEQRYGQKALQRDSVDWILTDGDFALFLECKAKRLSWDAKAALNDIGPLELDLANLAAGIVQVYKAILDYRDGLYPHFPAKEGVEVFPAVVTLENWFMFGPKIRELLHNAIVEQLTESKLPVEILEELPYSVVCVADLETGLQCANLAGLRDYWTGKVGDAEMRDWNWSGYNQHRFGENVKVKPLFADEYKDLFSAVQAI